MSYPELVGPAKDSPSPPNSLSAAWLDSRRKLGRGHHWFWSSLTAINSGPSWHRAARWTATVCGGLLGCALVLGPSHATLGLLGAQCANVGREEPLRRRTVSMAINGLVSLGFFFLGWYAAPYPWLIPPLITAMTFSTVWVWHALMVGPPGPTNTVFAGAYGTYMASTHSSALETIVSVNSLAFLFAALTSIALIAWHPNSPAREAIATAEAAVADYEASFDKPQYERGPQRSAAYSAVNEAWYTLRSAHTANERPHTAASRQLHSRLRRLHRRLVLGLQSESFPAQNQATGSHFLRTPLGRPRPSYLLRRAFHKGSRPWLTAVRALIAVLLATTSMFFSPTAHTSWAVLSALIVLQNGTSRMDMSVRALHRVVGTSLGLISALAIMTLGLEPWTKLVIIFACLLGMNLTAKRNYAVAVFFITTYSMQMLPPTAHYSTSLLFADRLLETLVGAATALVAIWLVGRHAPVLLVRRQYRAVLRAITAVLDDAARAEVDTLPASAHRRNLAFELSQSGTVLAGARADDAASLVGWHELSREISRFGFDVLASVWRKSSAGQAQQAQLAAAQAAQNLRDFVRDLPPLSTTNIDTAALTKRVSLARTLYLADA